MRKLKILLTEDNLGDVYLVRKALERYDIPNDLIVARDGAEALRLFASLSADSQSEPLDLLLLDLNLPKADGPEVLARFRDYPEFVHTPVIAMSSSDAPKDRGLMMQMGIARYFRKPSDLDAFLKLGELVKEVIGASCLPS